MTAAVFCHCEHAERRSLKATCVLASFVELLLLCLNRLKRPWPAEVQELVESLYEHRRPEPQLEELGVLFSRLFVYQPKSFFLIDGLDEFDAKEVWTALRIFQYLV